MLAVIDDGGGTAGPNYTISGIHVGQASTNPTTSVQVIIEPPVSWGSFGGEYTSTGSFVDPDGTFVSISNIFTISGLTPGSNYTLRARAYSGSGATGTNGNTLVITFTTPSVSNSSLIVAVPGSGTSTIETVKIIPADPIVSVDTSTPVFVSTPSVSDVNGITDSTIAVSATKKDSSVSRSLFVISNKSANPGISSVSSKNTGISLSSDYYAFGTSLFFQSTLSYTEASGGVGFFTNSTGSSGYFLKIQTTSNLSSNAAHEVQILKVVNNKAVRLTDTQESLARAINGVYGGVAYKIDIKVKVTGTTVVIDAYVNNFRITATDTQGSPVTNPATQLLPKTSTVAMFSSIGTTSFDYIYAIPITAAQYSKNDLYNVYGGQFAKATISSLYGNNVLSGFSPTGTSTGFVEEFGPIGRELRKVSVRYPTRPAKPIYASVGVSNYVEVIGSNMTSFGADIFLINNAGTFVPLDDASGSSFTIIGNSISESGQYQYPDPSIDPGGYQPDVTEPVVFSSNWIQKKTDAKALYDWVKGQWSHQQQVVNMEVFGNPLISVGDIVSILYSRVGMDGTQKFVVLSVDHTFDSGLGTKITCRSIYS